MSDIPPTTPTNSDSNPNPTTPVTNSDPNEATEMDSSMPNIDPLKMQAICCRNCTNYIALSLGDIIHFGKATYVLRFQGRSIPLFKHDYMLFSMVFNVHLGETRQNSSKDVVCDNCKTVLGWRPIESGPHFIHPACTMLLSRQGEENELLYSNIIIPPAAPAPAPAPAQNQNS
ncbi:hypothetical protein ACJIZ3_002416 [Penstemon smallii]|uniref:Yippee domain-containing protein n=1 Tax=Penstemon smallii TaxID=265156 RepID=A0ABD3UA40_9LAMI